MARTPPRGSRRGSAETPRGGLPALSSDWIFGHKGSAIFPEDGTSPLFLLGYLNSALATSFLKKIVNTTATAEIDDLIFDLFEIRSTRDEVRRFHRTVGRVERDEDQAASE